MVLLLSGCIGQSPTCNKPYILMGSSCCLDENNDGICDSDKPVCGSPYILVGKSCCLDGNGNGICDSDEKAAATATTIGEQPETSTSVTVTTTSIRSSTTTQEAGWYTTTSTEAPPTKACNVIGDCPLYNKTKCDSNGRSYHVYYTPISCAKGECIYGSGRDLGAMHCYDWEVCVNGVGCVDRSSTTTTTSTVATSSLSSTTLSQYYQNIIDRVASRQAKMTASLSTTTTTLLNCVDPDGGKKPEIRSVNASGYYQDNKTYIPDTSESCFDSRSVMEYYCEATIGGGYLHSIILDCGGTCWEGRCCKEEGRTCDKDSDCCRGTCRSAGMLRYCIS